MYIKSLISRPTTIHFLKTTSALFIARKIALKALLAVAVLGSLAVSVPGLSAAPLHDTTASIQVEGGSKTKHTPNEEGIFRKVLVPANGSVAVTLRFTAGIPGEDVAVVTEDGGTINEGKTADILPLDASREVSFTLHTTGNEGIYRVLVRLKHQTNTLQFWVGDEPTLKEPHEDASR